jgi:hypothetical protein
MDASGLENEENYRGDFMRKRISPVLYALLLSATPALADFEGVLEMKMTMGAKGAEGGGGGTMSVSVATAGIRSEMDMKMGAMEMKMVMLQKNANPDLIYQINDGSKTYTEIDLTKMRGLTGQPATAPEYSVETLGQETILGYQTKHVLVKEKGAEAGAGMTTELWTAKDLLDYETFSKLQARRGKAAGQEALVKALKDAGADGLPLKSIATMPDGAKVTMEVVKVDKKSLAASTFEIPAGYTKTEGGMMGMMGGMSGPGEDDAKKKMAEAQEKMQEALKNMSPEQREMIEKMMKQRQTPSQ